MDNLPSPKQTLNVENDPFRNLPVNFTDIVQERLGKYNQAFSENTVRARKADHEIFKKWCEENSVEPIPCFPENIERFLWESVSEPKVDENTGEIMLDKQGEIILVQIRSTPTVSRYLSTIKYVHDVAFELVQSENDPFGVAKELKNPADTLLVRNALRAIKLRFRSKSQRQAAPIRLKLIDQIIVTLNNSTRHSLYKALVSVGFDTMMRCSELIRVELNDINYHDDGSGSVYVPFHKSDQEGEGSYRYISATSVDLIHDWLTKSHITQGLLFRSVTRYDVVLDSMNKNRIARIYKTIAKLCGVDASAISAHSTRVGAAQELLTNGVSMPALMVAGDWKSSTMPVRYAKKINVATGAMAELAKVSGRS